MACSEGGALNLSSLIKIFSSLSPLRIQWSWRENWPDAGQDQCAACGVARKIHKSMDHRFVEAEMEA